MVKIGFPPFYFIQIVNYKFYLDEKIGGASRETKRYLGSLKGFIDRYYFKN